jgi:SNF family Na+-dependent transporter
MSQAHDERWGTRIGVILAVAGSAVGLGNFLRFPGQAAANGGGAFMIPYFAALLLVGIPICWAEWAMGRWGGMKGFHSSPSILGVIGQGRVARYLGILGVLIPLAVSFYYTYIEAWCLGYFWEFLTGGIGIDVERPIAEQTARAAEFYTDLTGRVENGIITGGTIETFICWALAFSLNIWLVYRGLSRGIERFVSYAMPLMALCALVVLIRVLTLGTPDPARPDQNVINGLGYLWNPDFSALGNPQTWLAAAGQIFFSLSVGFGVIINYASYLRRKDDVVLSGLTATATNELFEVGFGGLITITAAYVFLGAANMVEAVQGGSFGLGFQTLPVVFAHMGEIGNLVGAVFFFMLFLAAITSSISMYQPTLAFLQESLGWSRKGATTLMVSLCLLGSFLVMYFSKGGIFWSTIDDWVGTFLIFVLAMVQIILFSWVWGIDRGLKEAHEGALIHIPRFYRWIMKYVTPTYLLVIFGAFCWRNLPEWIRGVAEEPLRQGAMALILGVTAFLVGCVVVGERRWRAAGLDIDGKIDA